MSGEYQIPPRRNVDRVAAITASQFRLWNEEPMSMVILLIVKGDE
jgi:hypothetical protein